jgi:adenylate cyclase
MSIKTRTAKKSFPSLQESPFPDAIFYGIAMVLCWPLMLIVFWEKPVQSYPWISHLSSCSIVVLLIITDLGVTLYHTKHACDLRPAYTTYTLLVCYVFLPLTKNKQAFILGLIVTLCHLVVLGSVTYCNTARIYERVSLI